MGWCWFGDISFFPTGAMFLLLCLFSLPHPAPPYQMCEELLLLPHYTHFPNSLSFVKNKDDVTFSLH